MSWLYLLFVIASVYAVLLATSPTIRRESWPQVKFYLVGWWWLRLQAWMASRKKPQDVEVTVDVQKMLQLMELTTLLREGGPDHPDTVAYVDARPEQPELAKLLVLWRQKAGSVESELAAAD